MCLTKLGKKGVRVYIKTIIEIIYNVTKRKKKIILILKLSKQINEVFIDESIIRNDIWKIKIISGEIVRLYKTFLLSILIFIITTLIFFIKKWDGFNRRPTKTILK